MKRNAILIVICLLIVAFFYWDQDREKKKEEKELQEKTLISLTKDEVKEVTIDRHDVIIKAVKDNEQWKLIQPLQAMGDLSAWNTIVNTLADGKRERVIAENTDSLSPFGLANSTLKVTLSGIDNATATTLIFGKETPVSGKHYAMIEGASDVVTIDSYWQNTVAKSLYDLRDKTLLKLDTPKIQKIDIVHPTGEISLERKGENEWAVVKPFISLADDAAIQDLINKLTNGKIKQFIEEKPDIPAIYGMENPRLTLTFWEGDDPTGNLASHTLIVGSTSTETGYPYAKHGGKENVFSIEETDLEKVPADAESLRMKKVTSIRSWEIRYVKAVSADATILEATKGEGDWMLLAPQEGKADYNSISTAIRSITDLEAVSFSQETLDFSQPEITLELKSEAKSVMIPIVSKETDGVKRFYALRQKTDETLQVPVEAVEKMLADIQQVKGVTPTEPADAAEITEPTADSSQN